MKKLLGYIRKFITMNVRDEEESKELAILLRIMSLLYTGLFFFSSIPICFAHYYFISVLAILCLGVSIGVFILTFEGKTNLALKIFEAVTIASSCIFTCILGWKGNFQWLLILGIMVYYFPIDIELRTKENFVKICGGLLIALTLFTHLLPISREIPQGVSTFYQLIVCAFYIMSFGFLANRFCIKFNDTDEKLKETNNKLKQMASIDALTQLINRRQMNENLSMEVYEFTKNGTPFVIAIADVDLFKKINDSYGHDTGDYVLKELAIIFMKTMEGRGYVARWGGEEFLFCFEKLSGSKAYSILELMRKNIEHHNFNFKNETLHITITIGVEEYSEILGIESTISNADAKLYKGKNNGRNQVVF